MSYVGDANASMMRQKATANLSGYGIMRALVKCGCADLRSGKMRTYTADIICGCMGTMRM